MIFIDNYESSFWNKSLFSGCIIVTLIATLWLMFAEYATSNTWLKEYQLAGDLLRRILISSCLVIYFVRLQVTVWVFQKRKWTWLETITITVLMSFVLYAFASGGGNNKQVVGAVEIIGILFYLSGSYINTHSEYYRHVWKLKKKNRGRLYTKGLFSLAMHINYFGDIVLFTGLAMITHSLSMLIIPLIMAMNFVFNIIPSLDRYLEKKYKDEFRDYSKKTKKLIPLIY
ncbi:methyltransferase family protein [Thermodesulfobacteriota bacterium]